MKNLSIIASCFAALLMISSDDLNADTRNSQEALQEEEISVTISIEPFSIEDSERGQQVFVKDFGRLLIPGKPSLPSKIFAIAIPPGAEVVEVNYRTGDGVSLPGNYEIAPAQLPRVIDQEDPDIYSRDRMRYEENFKSVYESDDPYPADVVEFVRTAGFRKYNLVDVRITPFAYRPLSGQLTSYSEVTIDVTYRFPKDFSTSDIMNDDLSRTEQIAEELVTNYHQAGDWYPGAGLGRGTHDFVIITIESLLSSITPLVNWETSKGRTVEVVTIAWINGTYIGYDLAERMRNFLRDKYPSEEWGIEDVLLIGDYDDVPMRRTAQDLGYGEPETDFYYAELSLPDSESWDADGDHQYGEYSDPVDFYSEVNVGRIPWSSSVTVASICEKSVSYEQNSDPAFKKNILLLGGYFWADTDNAVMMEYKVDSDLHPWMSDWTLTRMYEKNTDYWSSYDCDYPLLHSNVMSVWPAGQYAFVNWAGHGSPTSTHIYGLGAPAFISSSDCPSLNDDYPAIIFADACSNSDTDHPNIGRAMLQQGAVGFVGATKVAYGCGAWDDPSDGSSQSLDYFFTTCVTSGDYSQGAALQWALRQMYTLGLWDALKYETFEWGALWGNPNLWMALPAIEVRLPDGTPEYAAPGVATTIVVQIRETLDTYVPGSGMLHYRYDGGTYLTSPLISVGGDLYEATLPAASCIDLPEYYFSAEGQSIGVLYNPSDAPATAYSTLIGSEAVQWQDDFEADQGWIAENLGATSGDWQRGVPVNDPGWDYDPVTDGDDSGQCFLTQNEFGNTDVDDGAVRLISPIFDMSDGRTVDYEYYLFLTNNPGGVDMLLVEVNNDGGVGSWVEIVSHNIHGSDWRHHEITEADLVAAGVMPTATMRLRFTANDAEPQSIVEAGVDGFTVSKLECTDPYICGDADGNDIVEISDAVFLINYILIPGSPAPDPLAAGDTDCNAIVEISDAVYLINYILTPGSPPPCDTDNDGMPDC